MKRNRPSNLARSVREYGVNKYIDKLLMDLNNINNRNYSYINAMSVSIVV